MNKETKNLQLRYDLFNETGFLCELCAHLKARSRKQCVAYPRGIPPEIWNGEIDHRHNYYGDQGIMFEPKNDSAALKASKK